MRYEDPQGEAALRYDRWGTRRGQPYAADPAWDDPPGRGAAADADAWTGGGGGGWAGPANRWDEPGRAFRPPPRRSRWAERDGGYGGYGGADDGFGGGPADGYAAGGFDAYDDGYAVDPVRVYGGPWLPPRIWARWRRRPWFPRFYGMLRRARPAGVLRHRSTGARYPVFRGRFGGRGWRVVTRPRGGMRFEVVGLEAETGFGNEAETGVGNEAEAESEMLALPGAGASTSTGYAPTDLTSRPGGGYRLRLPHQGVHTILARLRPEQLRALTGGGLPADPAAAVARGVGRIARRARRMGRLRNRRGGPSLDVFGTPGFRLLVRPTGEMEGEILAVTPVEGEVTRSVNANVTWHGPYKFTRKGVLKPTQKGQTVPNLNTSGVYLVEKQGKKNPNAAYVGQADDFKKRLGTREEHMRQLAASTRRHRVYLGIPSGPQSGLDDVEHATVRSVVRGLANAGPNADATRKAAPRKDKRVTNERPHAPFKVGPGGLNVTHAAAPGQSIPGYLRSGTGNQGQWYEVGEQGG